jgi:drug/metabolite transporter (DMT)-like permease
MIERVEATGFVPRPSVGIGLALLAFALFTFMDTVVKLLGGRYHVVQILFFNSIFALAATCAIAGWNGGVARIRTRYPGLHLVRWVISFIGTLSVFYAYARLPLAYVYAVLFASPLIITALSVPLLGEQVGWRRWSAVAVGFVGVLVILRPEAAGIEPLALFALVGALGHALNMIIVRRLGRTDPVETFGFYGNLLSMVGAGLLLPLFWVQPTLADVLLSALAGSIAGSGFWLLATAFRHAPAAVVAPFQYSQMPYGILVGWLLFANRPDPKTLLGAAIVIASGIYILRREAALREQHRERSGSIAEQ